MYCIHDENNKLKSKYNPILTIHEKLNHKYGTSITTTQLLENNINLKQQHVKEKLKSRHPKIYRA